MAIDIPATLRQWLIKHGLVGYIRFTKAKPHPNAHNIGMKINVDIITNPTIRKKLGLSPLGDRCFDSLPTAVLEKYFGEYSASTKAYKTQ